MTETPTTTRAQLIAALRQGADAMTKENATTHDYFDGPGMTSYERNNWFKSPPEIECKACAIGRMAIVAKVPVISIVDALEREGIRPGEITTANDTLGFEVAQKMMRRLADELETRP